MNRGQMGQERQTADRGGQTDGKEEDIMTKIQGGKPSWLEADKRCWRRVTEEAGGVIRVRWGSRGARTRPD